jgi:hypothetical protein
MLADTSGNIKFYAATNQRGQISVGGTFWFGSAATTDALVWDGSNIKLYGGTSEAVRLTTGGALTVIGSIKVGSGPDIEINPTVGIDIGHSQVGGGAGGIHIGGSLGDNVFIACDYGAAVPHTFKIQGYTIDSRVTDFWLTTTGDILLEPASGKVVSITRALNIVENASTPTQPPNGTEVQLYMKGNKFVIRFYDGTNNKYRVLDLASTNATWAYQLTAP